MSSSIKIDDDVIWLHNLFEMQLLSLHQNTLVLVTERKSKMLPQLVINYVAENIHTDFIFYRRLENYMKSHWSLKFLLTFWNKPSKNI